MSAQPVDRVISKATRRRTMQGRTVLQESVQQLHLDAWKGEIIRMVGEGLNAGRVDVRKLVSGQSCGYSSGERGGWGGDA